MPTASYWPTSGWRTSLPEEQDINGDALVRAYDYLRTHFPALRQLTIIRHGQAVFQRENPDARENAASIVLRVLLKGWSALFRCPSETFLHSRENRWNIRSATKSVISILAGMALDEKLIGSLDECVADILPEYFSDAAEAAKRRITIRHLLTMTSGLRSVEGGSAAMRMLASRNWTSYMARLPLTDEPGKRFRYNSANPHLLSAVISKRAGGNLLEYATTHLFAPLGIQDVVWGAGPEGIPFGGGNLFLSADDLAKIGLLMLHGGCWDDTPLVSPAWVTETLRPHQVYFPGWDYGYLWYLHEEPDKRRNGRVATFSAAGAGGQKLLVIPELDLILAAVAKTDFVAEKGIVLNRAISTLFVPAVQGR